MLLISQSWEIGRKIERGKLVEWLFYCGMLVINKRMSSKMLLEAFNRYLMDVDEFEAISRLVEEKMNFSIFLINFSFLLITIFGLAKMGVQNDLFLTFDGSNTDDLY